MEWNEDYTTAIVAVKGDYRAVIERDSYPSAPDYDGMGAVLRIEPRGYVADIDVKSPDGDTFERAARHFCDYYGTTEGIGILERYARIFHGTRDFRTFGYSHAQDATVYVVCDSAAMREAWGCPDAEESVKGDETEWQAYIDGDVYSVRVEHRLEWSKAYSDGTTETGDEWFPVDGTETGGYYGEQYAVAAATEALESI